MPIPRHLATLASSLPIEDQAALSNLPLNEITTGALARAEAYLERIREIEQHVVTLRSLYNAGASIHSLPAEVLLHVFLEGYTSRVDLRLSHVCRYWRSIIAGTPRFWVLALEKNYIHVRRASELLFLEHALALSGARPLRILLYLKDSGFEATMTVLRPVHYQSRLRSLEVKLVSNNDIASLERTLVLGLESLETFGVSCDNGNSLTRTLTLHDQSLPRLRFLAIHGVLFTATSTVSRLERLDVLGMIQDPYDLGRALRRCISLQSLNILRTMSKRWAGEPGDLGISQAVLPHLLSLIIEDFPPMICKLLIHLNLPQHTSTTLLPRSDTVNAGQWEMPAQLVAKFEKESPLDRMHLSYPEDGDYAVIRVFSGAHQRLRAEKRLSKHMYRTELVTLLGIFKGFSITTLTVDIPMSLPHGPRVSAWPRILFTHFRHLYRLELLGRVPGILKYDFAARFLELCGRGGCEELTLCWVLLVPGPGLDDDESGQAPGGHDGELNHLISALDQECSDELDVRLILYSVDSDQGSYDSLADVPSNAERTRTYVAPVLERLSEQADDVVIR